MVLTFTQDFLSTYLCETFSQTWRGRDQRHGPSRQRAHSLDGTESRKQPHTLQCGKSYSRSFQGLLQATAEGHHLQKFKEVFLWKVRAERGFEG